MGCGISSTIPSHLADAKVGADAVLPDSVGADAVQPGSAGADAVLPDSFGADALQPASVGADAVLPDSAPTPGSQGINKGCDAGSANHAVQEQKDALPPSLPATICKGITLRGLRCLRVKILKELVETSYFPGANNLYQLPSRRLVVEWVRNVNVTGRKRLAEVGSIIKQEDIGHPTYFISHGWNTSLGKLFDTIEGYLSNASEETCVWLDFVAVNQHKGTPEFASDISCFVDIIRQCGGGTIVIVDMSEPRLDPSHQGLSTDDRVTMVSRINVDEAESEMPEDKIMILDKIRAHHGSTELFNIALQTQLMLRPLSYRVDRMQLSMRSKGTRWRMDRVEAWYRQGGSRALCIMAKAGTGKSTMADYICESILGIPREVDSNGSNASGHQAASGQLLHPPNAAHFMKYSDRRRLDPVAFIKSLAFQLALRSREMNSKLPKDVKAIEGLQDGEAAFNLLLKPLFEEPNEEGTQEKSAHELGISGHSTHERGTQEVVILVDALDEGDPPEQMQQLEQDSADASSTAQKVSVKACANQVLSVIIRFLPLLPKHVRFIFTSRPDAVCGGIHRVLERTFPSSVTFIDNPGKLIEAGHN
eukprot:gene28728-31904_t